MINISFYIPLVFIFWKSTLNMLYSKISAHAQITFCLFSQYLILIQKDTKYRAHNMLIICLFFLVNPSRNTLLHKYAYKTVSYTHLRAHETEADLVCRLLLEKKKLTVKSQQAFALVLSYPLQTSFYFLVPFFDFFLWIFSNHLEGVDFPL